MNIKKKRYFGSVLFSVFPNVCAHLVKVGNNRFPCVQTKFGKSTIWGESTQFWSLEYTNKKFGVGMSDVVMKRKNKTTCKHSAELISITYDYVSPSYTVILKYFAK